MAEAINTNESAQKIMQLCSILCKAKEKKSWLVREL